MDGLYSKKYSVKNIDKNSLSDIFSQNVSMALRAHSDYEVTKPLTEIGWRASKQYFNVSWIILKVTLLN